MLTSFIPLSLLILQLPAPTNTCKQRFLPRLTTADLWGNTTHKLLTLEEVMKRDVRHHHHHPHKGA